MPKRESLTRKGSLLLSIGVFGAALLYGDGMITPAIGVLGAIEGLEVATPVFQPYVTPIAVAVLVGLFSVQRFGTGGGGRVFGPVMFVWFLVLALLGVRWGICPGCGSSTRPTHNEGRFSCPR